jgi:hypothetical protein
VPAGRSAGTKELGGGWKTLDVATNSSTVAFIQTRRIAW